MPLGSLENFVNDPFINCFLFAGHISLSNLKETIQILDKICQLLFKLIEIRSDRIEMDWNGLDWIGLDWIEFHWIGFH